MDSREMFDLLKSVAQEVILPRFRSLRDDEVHEKNPGDLVTDADREAEVLITKELRAQYPDALVVGEEATAEAPDLVHNVESADHVFTVDPIDGTKNFVHGRPDYGVMVAEMVRGTATRSWIWQPTHGTAWYAHHEEGVFKDGQRVDTPTLGNPLVCASSDPRDEGYAAPFTVRGTKWACAMDYPMLASGEVDALLYRCARPWDHVPGLVVAEALGGESRYLDGSPYHGGVSSNCLLVTARQGVFEKIAPEARTMVARKH